MWAKITVYTSGEAGSIVSGEDQDLSHRPDVRVETPGMRFEGHRYRREANVKVLVGWICRNVRIPVPEYVCLLRFCHEPLPRDLHVS